MVARCRTESDSIVSCRTPYQKVTRRIPKEILDTLEGEMKRLSDNNRFLEEVRQGRIDFIMANDRFDLLALRELKRDKLSLMDFATIALFSAVTSHVGQENVSFFSFEEIKAPLRKTFEPTVGATFKWRASKEGSFDPKFITNFLKRAKELTPLQKICAVYKDAEPIEYHDKSRSEATFCEMTWSHAAALFGGINFFGRTEVKGMSDRRIMISFSLMQIFLDTLPYSVKLNPVLGTKLTKNIKYVGQDWQKEILILFRGIASPTNHGKYLMPGLEVSYHDFYLSVVVSFIPLEHKEAFVKIGGIINECRKEVEEERDIKVLNDLEKTILTMGFFNYLDKDESYNINIYFWLQVHNYILSYKLYYANAKYVRLEERANLSTEKKILEKIGEAFLEDEEHRLSLQEAIVIVQKRRKEYIKNKEVGSPFQCDYVYLEQSALEEIWESWNNRKEKGQI